MYYPFKSFKNASNKLQNICCVSFLLVQICTFSELAFGLLTKGILCVCINTMIFNKSISPSTFSFILVLQNTKISRKKNRVFARN